MIVLALGKRLTQGLADTMMTAKARYPINFIELGKDLCKPAL